VLLALLAAFAFSAIASADDLGVGILSLDPSISGSGDEFDIQNLTGTADLPPDYPVATPLTFDTISLTLNFEDGSTETLTASDFTSDGFGGFLGNGSFDLGGDPILSADLTGTLSPTTITLSDGTTETLEGTYTATMTDPSGGPLEEFDAAEIFASTGSAVTTPEPGTSSLLALGIAGLFGLALRRKYSSGLVSKTAITG
jgi:hypothetical protein